MGCASISILLNEVLKLIHYSSCKNVTLFRLGTCGGINLTPGTVVITEEAVDGLFRPEYRQVRTHLHAYTYLHAYDLIDCFR